NPLLTVYNRWANGALPILRFSKTGDNNVEEAYARHFVSPRKKGCQFEEGAIEVGNSAAILPAQGSSVRREAKAQGHESRGKLRLPRRRWRKKRRSVAASMRVCSAMIPCGVLPEIRTSLAVARVDLIA